jgi:hypothetical protein
MMMSVHRLLGENPQKARFPSDSQARFDAGRRGPSAQQLFEILWDTLADLLGSAAATTLLTRAVRQALPQDARLAGLGISRDGLRYAVTYPDTWEVAGEPAALNGFKTLARELCPLLVGLTGPVVVRRLDRLPLFRDCGVFFESKDHA